MRLRTSLAVVISILPGVSPLLLLWDNPVAAWWRCKFTPDVLTGWNLIFGMWFSLAVGTGFLWLLWYWLGVHLHLDDKDKPCWARDKNYPLKYGFPPCLLGVIERVVFTLVAAYQFTAVPVAMAAWLGLKMAAVWNRRPESVGQSMGAIRALLLGLVSLLFAALGGRIAAGSLLW
jgi:hypothetical protein